MATEVLIQKGGVREVQITVEDGNFETFVEEYDEAMNEAVAWQEVCKSQKRAKALRGSNIACEIPRGKTRKGFKKSLQKLEDSSVKDELESYELQLADALKCRRNLIDEIMETSNYLANLTSDEYKAIYRELAALENLQKLVAYADNEVIPGLQKAIYDLSIVEKEDACQIRRIRSSNYKDRKYGRRVKVRPDQPYKRNRDIARANKNAKKYAFA